MGKVSIIIVNYNGRHVLGELFESLDRQTCPAEEVIMVDNASTDGSVDFVKERFPWVQIIVSPMNVGFAEGNNIGFANARSEYIALLNNDTVVDEGWLGELVRTLDGDKRAGAAVSKIYLAADNPIIDCAGAEFNNLGLVWGRGANQADRGQFDIKCESPSLTACAALLRRSALEGAPLFDRELFMYYEEFDLALRLRGNGHTIVYIPTSVVHHKRSQSVKGLAKKAVLFQQFYGNRNRIKIVMKYYPPMVLLRSMPLILLSLGYWNWRFLRDGGPRLFLRALVAQTQYAIQGLFERLRGNTVSPEKWLPWMKHQNLREVLALKSDLGAYVE
jgi:GT2 family glycosyltransferase